MALGADMGLGGGTFSPGPPKPTPPGWPLKQQPKPPSGATTPYSRAPGGIGDDISQTAENNAMASGAGAGMATLQGMDRAGISRGKGQRSRADVAQAMADVGGRMKSQQVQQGIASANARNQQAYEHSMRMEQLGNKGLLEGLRSQGARERLAGQGWAQDIYEALANGQFGLDQMQLDLSPLVRSLLR